MESSLNTSKAAPAVRLRGVSKRFKQSGRDQTVLDDIDLAVERGEFVSLIGPSGCGKSTLLRLVAGLEPGYGGTIEVEGQAVQGPQKSCGLLFQEHRLFPWLTVAQNVALGAYHEGLERRELDRRIEETLERVHLGGIGKTFPQQLSGGMAQRVAIARLLMGSRSVMLLDEPFSALDAFTRLRLQGELQTLWMTTGATMILVTHDIEEAAYLSDRIVVMDAKPGRIKEIIENRATHPRSRVDAPFTRLKARLLGLLELEE